MVCTCFFTTLHLHPLEENSNVLSIPLVALYPERIVNEHSKHSAITIRRQREKGKGHGIIT